MFGSQVLPSFVFWVALLFVPETPRWLAGKNRTAEAAAVLQKTIGKEAAATELASIERRFATHAPASVREMFDTKYLPVLVVAVLIAVFHQVTGINATL